MMTQKELCIKPYGFLVDNFELMTFYHVQGQTHVLLKLVILMLNKQMWVYFNAIYSLVM